MDQGARGDPNTLLSAYVTLAADILDRDMNEIDVNVPIDHLFPKLAQWRKFSNRYLEIAQLSCDEAQEILGESHPDYHSADWRFEMRSLETLAAFSEPARKLLEVRQEKLEVPSLRSLETTFAARVHHPSGTSDAYYVPKKTNEVFFMISPT